MKKCTIYYYTLTDEMRKEEKWEWFSENKIKNIPFEHIQPDKNNNWLDLTDNDWETMIPIANKETKLSRSKNGDTSLFKVFSTGVLSSRDEWLYDFNKTSIIKKIEQQLSHYNEDLQLWLHSKKGKSNLLSIQSNSKLSWSDSIRNGIKKEKKSVFDDEKIIHSLYRPFVIKYLYFDDILCNTLSLQKEYFPNSIITNKSIWITIHQQVEFAVGGTKLVSDHGIGSRISQYFSLYRYDTNGNRIDNITDWGLEQFQAKYEQIPLPPFPKGENQDIGNSALMSENTDFGNPPLEKGVGGFEITKEDIFHYVYAVLHNPEYRKKYEMNLKREFPRIPFYDDFWKWAAWGKALMDLHINFETVEPFGLDVISINESIPLNPPFPKGESERSEQGDLKIKPKLKANKDDGTIELDNQTILSGIPSEAWEYKLGNRSALEWILDQYKEKKPKDPTIAEKFNTYRFIDYKDKVIDLIKRVTTVSVETVKIVEEMRKQRL